VGIVGCAARGRRGQPGFETGVARYGAGAGVGPEVGAQVSGPRPQAVSQAGADTQEAESLDG